MSAVAGITRLLRAAGLVVLVSAVAVSCAGREDEEATPTPRASPEASPTATKGEQPGAAGFRAFAAELDEALKGEPVAFLRERMRTTHIVCTQENIERMGLGGPACEFAGQEFDGFDVSFWQSEGATVPVETAVAEMEAFFRPVLADASDAFGSGAPQVYALNIGDGRFDAIVTAIIERPAHFAGEGPLRVALNTAWAFEGGRWRLTGVMYADVLAEALLQPTDDARGLFPHWERFRGS